MGQWTPSVLSSVTLNVETTSLTYNVVGMNTNTIRRTNTLLPKNLAVASAQPHLTLEPYAASTNGGPTFGTGVDLIAGDLWSQHKTSAGTSSLYYYDGANTIDLALDASVPTSLSITNLAVSNSGSITYLTASNALLGAVTYNGLQTGSIIVHPSAFVGVTNSTNYTISGDGSYIHLGSGEVVVAPIHLPSYAKTAHRFSAISNTNTSASTTTVELMHTNGWDISSVLSPGHAEIINVTGAGGVKLSVVSSNFSLMENHQLWVQITGGHGSHYIYGARFDYIY